MFINSNKLLVCFLFYTVSYAYGQNAKIDSLKNAIRSGVDDTSMIVNLNMVSRQLFMTGEYDSSMVYSEKAYVLAKKMLNSSSKDELVNNSIQRGIGASYNLKGLVYTSIGNYIDAISNFNASLEVCQTFNDKKGQASAYGNIGNVYYGQGNYTEAQRQFFNALKIREQIEDKKGIAFSYVSIGNVYSMIHNNDEAIKYYYKALKLFKELDDKYSLAGTYNNIAGIYTSKKYYDKALEMYLSYVAIMEEFGDKQSIADTYTNIGNIYFYKNQNEKALEVYEKAIMLLTELDDASGIAFTTTSLGDTYMAMKDYNKAKFYLFKGFKLAKEVNELDLIRDSYEGLYNYFHETGDNKQALENYKLFIIYNDSVANEETTKETTRAQMNYEFEKKEATTNLEQKKREAITKAESKKQQIIIWCICGVLCMVICFAIYAYQISLQKQKANIEITMQKEIIEEKQKAILDSIHYAKRIQTALLTSETYIGKSLDKLNNS